LHLKFEKANLTRRQALWLGVWSVLTVVGVILHGIAWIPPDRLDAGLSTFAERAFIKPAASILDAFTGPIWFAMNLLTGDWGVFSLFQSVIAHGIAAAGVLAVCRASVRWRARLARVPTSDPPAVPPSPAQLSRRRFLVDVPFTAAAVLGTGALADGALMEAFDLRVRKYEIPIADLPEQLIGFKAVFISDTHLGPRIPAEYIRKAVSMSLDLRPDIFFLGGDYVHAGARSRGLQWWGCWGTTIGTTAAA
jgi:hypothetical protein